MGMVCYPLFEKVMEYECMYLYLHIFLKSRINCKKIKDFPQGKEGIRLREQRYKVELLACICFVDLT